MKFVYFFILLSITSTVNAQKIKTAVLDLTSIKLDETVRIIPATFETVTKEMSYVDIEDDTGMYLQDSLQVLIKNAYTSNYILVNGKYKMLEQEKTADTIFYKSEPIIIRELCKAPEFKSVPDQYKTVPYYKLVKEEEIKNHTNLIPYSEIQKKKFRKTLSHQKMVTDTQYEIIPMNINDRPKSIEITGTKKEIKKFLKHPALKGIKYKFL